MSTRSAIGDRDEQRRVAATTSTNRLGSTIRRWRPVGGAAELGVEDDGVYPPSVQAIPSEHGRAGARTRGVVSPRSTSLAGAVAPNQGSNPRCQSCPANPTWRASLTSHRARTRDLLRKRLGLVFPTASLRRLHRGSRGCLARRCSSWESLRWFMRRESHGWVRQLGFSIGCAQRIAEGMSLARGARGSLRVERAQGG